jgi:hypothetical protein
MLYSAKLLLIAASCQNSLYKVCEVCEMKDDECSQKL